MLNLSTQIRKKDEKSEVLRKRGKLIAILYGPETKNKLLKLDYRSFEKIFAEAGKSSLISIEVEGTKEKVPVLIHEVQRDSLTEKFLHVDFYQPKLKEKMEAKIPLVFEGESRAVKDLEGTLIKNIQELEIKALPKDLPREIRVSVESLKTFEDNILIKDLKLPKEIEILKKPDEVIASVLAPERVEEELQKPIEEKVEKVEKVEGGKPEERMEEKKKNNHSATKS